MPRNLKDHCSPSAVHDGEWGESRGFLLKSTIISTVLSVFSLKHEETSHRSSDLLKIFVKLGPAGQHRISDRLV